MAHLQGNNHLFHFVMKDVHAAYKIKLDPRFNGGQFIVRTGLSVF